MINDRNDVAEAFPRSSPSGQHVTITPRGGLDRPHLVTVKRQRIPGSAWVDVLSKSEDPLALGMQQPGSGQVVDGATRSELGVKAQPGLWPQQPSAEGFAGYRGTDIYPPNDSQHDEWVIVIHFDDERKKNAFGLLMSLNMLIETHGGFDYTGADCCGWMKEAGFKETRVEHLVGPDSMGVGVK